MLIQIPVTITFDVEGTASYRRPPRVFTMRYDTEDTDRPADYCNQYPPPKDAAWYQDSAGVLFEFMSSAIDKAITKAAEADPESYAVLEDAR
jgi:hypothetical protein